MNKIEEMVERLCSDGVEYRSIGDVAECLTGATPNTKNPLYWGGDIPWMNSGEVNKRVITSVEGRITELGYDACSTHMLPVNSVVIALAGQGKTRGKVAITRIPLCTNQSLCGIIPKDQLLPDFLYHFLGSQYEQLRAVSSGDGTRGGLNLKMIRAYKVPVPPMEIQEEIVRVLDSFAELEVELEVELEAELEARKAQYAYYRDKLLDFSTRGGGSSNAAG